MSGLFYILYAILNFAILLYGINAWRVKRRWTTGLLLLVSLGLVWDNLVLSLGIWMEAGDLLSALSMPRFWMHQLFLPWVIIASFVQVRDLGIGWAARPGWLKLLTGFTLLLMMAGVMTRIAGVTFAPEVMDGVTRYVAHGVSGPPLVSIVSIGFVLVMGIFIWRKAGIPWVFVASLLVFIGEGVPVEFIRRVIGSGFEVVWMFVMFWLELKLPGRTGGKV